MNVPHKKDWDQIMNVDGKADLAFHENPKTASSGDDHAAREGPSHVDRYHQEPASHEIPNPAHQLPDSSRMRRSAPASDECPIVRSISSH